MGIEWVPLGWARVGRSRADPLPGSGHRQSMERGEGEVGERKGRGRGGEEREEIISNL